MFIADYTNIELGQNIKKIAVAGFAISAGSYLNIILGEGNGYLATPDPINEISAIFGNDGISSIT